MLTGYLLSAVLLAWAFFSAREKYLKNKVSKKTIFVKENNDGITFIFSLALSSEFSKIPSVINHLNSIQGINCVTESANTILVKKLTNIRWRKILPAIKLILKNKFDVIFINK